jgi:hypothetical protein
MRIPALDRKLLREVARLKGQIATIALVLASGITCFLSMRGTYSSLDWSRQAYYDRHRFADVFAHLERAPEAIARRIEEIPGVLAVETRVAEMRAREIIAAQGIEVVAVFEPRIVRAGDRLVGASGRGHELCTRADQHDLVGHAGAATGRAAGCGGTTRTDGHRPLRRGRRRRSHCNLCR